MWTLVTALRVVLTFKVVPTKVAVSGGFVCALICILLIYDAKTVRAQSPSHSGMTIISRNSQVNTHSVGSLGFGKISKSI